MSKAFITQYAIMKNNGSKPAADLPQDAMADEGAPTSIIEAILEKRRAAKLMNEELPAEPLETDLENAPEPTVPTRSEAIRARIKALRK